MRVSILIVIQAFVLSDVGAQAPYFPDVYLAPQFEAPIDAPSRVVVAGVDEPVRDDSSRPLRRQSRARALSCEGAGLLPASA